MIKCVFSECPHAIDNDSEDEDVIILWNYVSLTDKVNIWQQWGTNKQTGAFTWLIFVPDISTPNTIGPVILKMRKRPIDKSWQRSSKVNPDENYNWTWLEDIGLEKKWFWSLTFKKVSLLMIMKYDF